MQVNDHDSEFGLKKCAAKAESSLRALHPKVLYEKMENEERNGERTG